MRASLISLTLSLPGLPFYLLISFSTHNARHWFCYSTTGFYLHFIFFAFSGILFCIWLAFVSDSSSSFLSAINVCNIIYFNNCFYPFFFFFLPHIQIYSIPNIHMCNVKIPYNFCRCLNPDVCETRSYFFQIRLMGFCEIADNWEDSDSTRFSRRKWREEWRNTGKLAQKEQ